MTPSDTNVADILLWVVALSTFFSFGSLIWTVFSGPSRKNSARIEALEAAFNVLDSGHQRLRDTSMGCPMPI